MASAVLAEYESRYDGPHPVCDLELTFTGVTYNASGPDYFEALIGIRRQIEGRGYLLNIYGASRNVWPSGMSRSMGLALKAYKMTLGKQALMKDLVEIFATGPDVEPATVAEQKKFSEEWFASL